MCLSEVLHIKTNDSLAALVCCQISREILVFHCLALISTCEVWLSVTDLPSTSLSKNQYFSREDKLQMERNSIS